MAPLLRTRAGRPGRRGLRCRYKQVAGSVEELLRTRLSQAVDAVTGDPRWDVRDELLIQVMGYMLHGYAIGVGRLLCLLDVDVVEEASVAQLQQLGVGHQYADGLVRAAAAVFAGSAAPSPQRSLVRLGHSFSLAEGHLELRQAVFEAARHLMAE